MADLAPAPRNDVDSRPDDLLARADTAEAAGDLLAAIDYLTAANRVAPDGLVEFRIVGLRNRAFGVLDKQSAFADWPPERAAQPTPPPGVVPEITARELTADRLRHHMTADGCLLVRGVVEPTTAQQLVDGIDHALETWGALARPYLNATGSPWFDALPVPDDARGNLGRTWVTNSGGLLTADSPRMMFRLLEALEDAGLRSVVADYLGERPALSANKCTVRRVPVDTNAGWHQDGAFLGEGIRALNVWVALTPCGRDSPGLDLLPRRLEEIVETGTRGAYFDWAVGSDLVAELAQDTPIVRPEFRAGDALLFDDLYLHRTATEPSMLHSRYAIETWCFAPSAYPPGHVPIVW